MFCTTRKAFTALLAAASCLLGSASAFTNPVRRPGGSDPFIAYSGDGYYYMTSTSWNNLQIARSRTIEGLKTAPKKVVYSTNDRNRCCNVWAPEVHYLDGNWYIYYTAGNANNLDGQNMHVLKGGPSAWDGYRYAGQLTRAWSIDGSVIRVSGWGNYMAYSCFHGVRYQSTCLQKLGNDNVSLTGPISVISQPSEYWERSGTPVQEGQVALYYGGKTYIVYSANYCWTPDYCLATLEWDGRSDPMWPGAWKKSNGCVFSKANGHYGTGHNSFFQSPDGSQTWNVYHATSNPNGACDDSRYAMVQVLGTHSDGSPNFGTPLPFNTNIGEPSR